MIAYILIPVFNEGLNLDRLHGNLSKALSGKDVRYVFVDDFSTDNSVQIISNLFPKELTTVITKPKNEGPGDSFNRGFEWILENSENNDDIIITLEADNTSDTGILNNMIDISTMGFELVLASIYAQSGGFSKTSFFRKLISFFANMIFRSIFNIKVLTLSSFYRIYHVSLLRRIKQNYPILINEKGFICMLEILLKAIKSEAKIIEVPMTLRSDERKGRSKMKIFKTSMSYLRFLLFAKK